MQKLYTIYKTTNTINNKFYIRGFIMNNKGEISWRS